MTLTTTAALVGAAYEAGRGVAAFNAINLETVEAIAAGAESANRPVIVQISENAVRYHGGLAPLAQAAIAVAVGSSHKMTTRDAALDEALIARLRRTVPVPLALHGSSGVSDEGLTSAIAAGMTKINIATQLDKAFTAAVREALGADPARVDQRRYLGAGRDAMATEAARLLTPITT